MATGGGSVRYLEGGIYKERKLSHDDYIDKVHKAEYVSLQVEFSERLT